MVPHYFDSWLDSIYLVVVGFVALSDDALLIQELLDHTGAFLIKNVVIWLESCYLQFVIYSSEHLHYVWILS